MIASAGFVSGRGSLAGGTNVPGSLGFQNSGTMAFSGGFTDIRGDVTNFAGSKIITSGGGTTTFYDDVTHNGAEIRTSLGARTVFLGSQSGAGPFTGPGTVEYQGDLRPGNCPAFVVYGGDLVMGHGATLHVELGGTVPGLQFDAVQVLGTASLDGMVQVRLLDGFIPELGQRFDFMTFGSHIGDFAGFSGLDLVNGLALRPSLDGQVYGLVVAPVPEPASWFLAALAVGFGALPRRKRTAIAWPSLSRGREFREPGLNLRT